ncbi:hypothetical protein [Neobacillus kokaensis]|uniref:Multidrug ABC transporter ATPase n=1 Tax=Neobacillus kokaensis TaxID=2759023 RepID=A0ABQ3N1G1_9BACI|nr:hypothetical protein [Neobacillus kokaensis]GHH98768.1 hypothetical protein AM1BK_23110 [Neobacillus kokaensis]
MTKNIPEKIMYADNSSMARNLKEVKKLGKEMEQEKTGEELKKEDGLTPDPKQ